MKKCTFALITDATKSHLVGYQCQWKSGHAGEHHSFPGQSASLPGPVTDLGPVEGIRHLAVELSKAGWEIGSADLCQLARTGRIPCTLYVPNRPSSSLWSEADIQNILEWFEAEWRGSRQAPQNVGLLDMDAVLRLCNFGRSGLEYWQKQGQLKPTAYVRTGRGRPSALWSAKVVEDFIQSVSPIP